MLSRLLAKSGNSFYFSRDVTDDHFFEITNFITFLF